MIILCNPLNVHSRHNMGIANVAGIQAQMPPIRLACAKSRLQPRKCSYGHQTPFHVRGWDQGMRLQWCLNYMYPYITAASNSVHAVSNPEGLCQLFPIHNLINL